MTDRFAGLDYQRERRKGKRLGTLWYNEEVTGDVTLSPLFEDLDSVARLDVLGDIIGLLQREYDAAFKEKWPQLRGKKK